MNVFRMSRGDPHKIHIKQKIKQHERHYNSAVNAGAPEE